MMLREEKSDPTDVSSAASFARPESEVLKSMSRLGVGEVKVSDICATRTAKAMLQVIEDFGTSVLMTQETQAGTNVFLNPTILDAITAYCDKSTLSALMATHPVSFKSAGLRLYRQPAVLSGELEQFIKGFDRDEPPLTKDQEGQEVERRRNPVSKWDLFRHDLGNSVRLQVFDNLPGRMSSLQRYFKPSEIRLSFQSRPTPASEAAPFGYPGMSHSATDRLPHTAQRYFEMDLKTASGDGRSVGVFEVFGDSGDLEGFLGFYRYRGLAMFDTVILNIVPPPHIAYEEQPMCWPNELDVTLGSDGPITRIDDSYKKDRAPHQLIINVAALYRTPADAEIVDRTIASVLGTWYFTDDLLSGLFYSKDLTIKVYGLELASSGKGSVRPQPEQSKREHQFLEEPRDWRTLFIDTIDYLWLTAGKDWTRERIEDAKKRFEIKPLSELDFSPYHYIDFWYTAFEAAGKRK